MTEQESHFYEFGRFRLDASERVLLRDQDFGLALQFGNYRG